MRFSLPMVLVTLKNGLTMPQVGLGTWQLQGEECKKSVMQALAAGYSHIDTAQMYGNEEQVGAAVSQVGSARENLFITSKVWRSNLGKDAVRKACEESLKNLGTEYLDLLLIHWPNKDVPIRETLQGLKSCVDAGLVKSVGVSNFTIAHLKEALPIADELEVPIVVNQVEFHPSLYQSELLDFCSSNDIFLTAYSPLGRGDDIKESVVVDIAKVHDVSPAQVVLRWCMQKGCVVIPKASSKDHLEENLDLDFSLSDEDVRRLDSLDRDNRVIDPDFGEFDKK